MSVLVWLAIAAGGLLVVLAAVLALLLLVPVVIDAAWGEGRRTLSLAGPGVWLGFDLAARSLELRLFSRRLRRWSMADGGERKRRAERRRATRLSPARLWAQRRRVLSLLGRFFRRVRVRRLALEAMLATPDPAVTGWLTGAAFAVRGVMPPDVSRGVRLTPDFEAEAPRVALDASVRLRPLHGALLALNLWRVARRARKPPSDAAGPGGMAAVWAATAWRAARRGGRRTPGDASRRHDRGTDRPSGGGREQP